MAMEAQLESQMQDLGHTQLALLDLIDDIQAAQIQTDNLPQIAVVGDQSSGKSSALETITGVPFHELLGPAPSMLLKFVSADRPLLVSKFQSSRTVVEVQPHRLNFATLGRQLQRNLV